MLESLTFLLAAIGYGGLTAAAVRAARGAVPVAVLRGVAAVISVHVILVWTVRYEGRISEATRNGFVGFVLFHAALAATVGSLFVGERLARRLIVAAFGVVSAGALGAVFRYDVVAVYRVPVVLCAIIGIAGLVRAYVAPRGRPAPPA